MDGTIIVTNGIAMRPRPWDHGSIPNPRPTYSLHSGSLPTGITFPDADGMISGTPSDTPGNFDVTLRANNGGSNVDFDLRITVVDPVSIATSVPSNYPIYYWNESGGTKAAAAAAYLRDKLNGLISGSDPFTITDGTGQSQPATGFMIGECPYTGFELPDGTDEFDGDPNPERFVCKMVGDLYLLRGSTGRLHMKAVTWFLEEYMGFHLGPPVVTSANPLPPGSAGAPEVMAPAEAALPLLAPKMEERVLSRHIIENRASAELQSQDYVDQMGTSLIDPEWGMFGDTLGASTHDVTGMFRTGAGSGGHATLGAYFQNHTGIAVKDASTVGITGTFVVDETVEVRRLGVLIGTFKVAWPSTGLSMFVFGWSRNNSATFQTDDVATGLTSGATCVLEGDWLTSQFPWQVLPCTENSGADPYDIEERDQRINAGAGGVPRHLCYSDPSLALVMSTIMRNRWAGLSADDRAARIGWLANTQDASGLHCVCQRCLDIYEDGAWDDQFGTEHRPKSETLVRLLNNWLADVRTYTGFETARVGSDFYLSPMYDAPTTALDSGAVPRVIQNGGCQLHSWAESCPDGRQYEMALRRWATKCEWMKLWMYGQGFGANSYRPIGFKGRIHTIRRARELGIRGCVLQGSNVTGGERIAIKGELRRQALWQPAYEESYILKRFCDRYYEDATQMAQDFYNRIEDAADNVGGYPKFSCGIFSTTGALLDTGYYSQDLIDDVTEMYEDAQAAVNGDSTLTTRVHELFAPTIASLYGCYPDGSDYGAPGTTWTIGSHPTIPGREVFLIDGVYLYDYMRNCADHSRLGSCTEFSNGAEPDLLALSQCGGEVVRLTLGLLEVLIPVNVESLRIWRMQYDGVDIIPEPTFADGYQNHEDAFGIKDWGFSSYPGDRTYWCFGGGSRMNSGQGGGDNGGEKVEDQTYTTVKHRSTIGVGSGGGPNPDGWHYADVTLDTDGSGNPYVEIVYSMKNWTAIDAQHVTAPDCITSYPGSVTLVKDDINKFTVSNIPGLSGITVTDEYLDLENTVVVMQAGTHPYCLSSRKRAAIKFGSEFAISTVETPWCRRRITVHLP